MQILKSKLKRAELNEQKISAAKLSKRADATEHEEIAPLTEQAKQEYKKKISLRAKNKLKSKESAELAELDELDEQKREETRDATYAKLNKELQQKREKNIKADKNKKGRMQSKRV